MQNNVNSYEEKQARLLDKAESAFWLLDRISSMNFAVIAEGEGDLNPDTIRKALDFVQTKHPLANVKVKLEKEFRLSFQTATENKIHLKVFKLENPDWKKKIAEEVMIPFLEGESPLIRAIFFRSESGNWIFVVVFHHSIADGRSGFSFLAEILRECSSNLDNYNIFNYQKIPNSVLSLLKTGNENPEKFKKPNLSEEIRVKTASLPAFSKKNQDSNPVVTRFQLAKEELQNLLRLCRNNETTLHGIIGAAQLVSLYSLFETTDPILLNLSNPADLKKDLTEKVPAETLGLYITLLTLGVVVREKSDLWEIAKEISSGLKARIGNGYNDVSFYDLIPPADQILSRPNGVKAFSALLQRFPQSSVLSNVGILPDLPKFDHFDVSNLSFTVHPSLSQSVFVSASTYRETLTILLNYDSNRWVPGKFEVFKEKFEGFLRGNRV
ncbi:phthiocerol/phthiodiolone dimycocerosyl transferase family protein [Leptospira adleri]|uniref:phthiocerol/phthiodiolone dimycocerosyl transferase family protein n=1 Tax=Leptospira adleri TaxID=2023186 RepID=UPI001082D726|nr:condensation domain-containing protein [Leptospira adleri]TGM53390.1 condensation protein [Leptospira adleri]